MLPDRRIRLRGCATPRRSRDPHGDRKQLRTAGERRAVEPTAKPDAGTPGARGTSFRSGVTARTPTSRPPANKERYPVGMRRIPKDREKRENQILRSASRSPIARNGSQTAGGDCCAAAPIVISMIAHAFSGLTPPPLASIFPELKVKKCYTTGTCRCSSGTPLISIAAHQAA